MSMRCLSDRAAGNRVTRPRWPIWATGLLASIAAITLGLVFPGQDRALAAEAKLTSPEDVTIPTSDGVTLHATFYAGEADKDSVPVILLHDYEGSRKDYADLALLLQKAGHSVLVADLRGHGESTLQTGMARPLEPRTLSRVDFAKMAEFDFHALKFYLLAKNNKGELNIEKLCVVGAGMGASVALHATAADWNILPAGNKKQGQDVKAVVLISPGSRKGAPVLTALSGTPREIKIWDPQLQRAFKEPEAYNFAFPVPLDFRSEVSFFIVVGESASKERRDAKRLQSMLDDFHPKPSSKEKQSLFYAGLPTSLQGTKLLGKSLKLEQYIAKFIEIRAVERKYPWQERRNPYER